MARLFVDVAAGLSIARMAEARKPDEQAALMQAITGTPDQNALRLVGKLSPRPRPPQNAVQSLIDANRNALVNSAAAGSQHVGSR